MDFLAPVASHRRPRIALDCGGVAHGNGAAEEQCSLHQRPDGIGARHLWEAMQHLPSIASKRGVREAWISHTRRRRVLSYLAPSASPPVRPHLYITMLILP